MSAPAPGTPLPWYATECEGYVRIRNEASDAVLASMEDGTHPEVELIPFVDQQANAAYIVHAANCFPELVEALFKMRFAHLPSEWDAAILQADAALAKAGAA